VFNVSTPENLNQDHVERTIASGFRFLKFPAALEESFEAHDAPKRRIKLAIGALLGILTYDSFLFSDWLLSPATFHTAVMLRFGLVTPIELLATLGIFFAPTVLVRELLILVFGALLPTATQLYLTSLGDTLSQDNRHQAVILVVMFVIMVQRIRFWFAIPACLLSFALYATALARIPDYPARFAAQSNIVFLGTVTFSLFVAYTLEREYRLNYLLGLRSSFQNRTLGSLSRRDALTGLFNRRSLDELLHQSNQATEHSLVLSVILIDIDHFKAFNDTSGHRAGDRCLRSIAEVLKTLCSGEFQVFRYGGEEFLVTLPGTELRQAIETAELLRRAVELAQIPHAGLSAGSIVTASFGVASAIPSPNLKAEEIVEAADTALYAAKRAGRNQVRPQLPHLLCLDENLRARSSDLNPTLGRARA
jgi:diguanylate cyclase (GGDEF)-like protein